MISGILPFVLVPLITSHQLGQFQPAKTQTVIAERSMSLEDRQYDRYVNDVFKYNILLNLAYLSDSAKSGDKIEPDKVLKDSTYEFKLEPGKTFSFHDGIMEKYRNTTVKTTHAHFGGDQGFKSDGYLMGDGVCHFASLINAAAKEANLSVEAPSNHDFAAIPEIDRKDGVAIYFDPGSPDLSSKQNLYITNNKSNDITFKFEYSNSTLKVKVLEENS